MNCSENSQFDFDSFRPLRQTTRGRLFSGVCTSLFFHLALVVGVFVLGSTLLSPLLVDEKPMEVMFVTIESHADDPARGMPDGLMKESAAQVQKTTPEITAVKSKAEDVMNKKQEVRRDSKEKIPEKPTAIVPAKEIKKIPERIEESSTDSAEKLSAIEEKQSDSTMVAEHGVLDNSRVSDQAASRASLGLPSGKGIQQGVPYEQVIVNVLSKYKRYPDRARRRGITGDGILKIRLERTGELGTASVVESTGSTLLDDELLKMAKRASPFPAAPDNYPDKTIEFLVPVSFSFEE